MLSKLQKELKIQINLLNRKKYQLNPFTYTGKLRSKDIELRVEEDLVPSYFNTRVSQYLMFAQQKYNLLPTTPHCYVKTATTLQQ